MLQEEIEKEFLSVDAEDVEMSDFKEVDQFI